MQGYMWKRQNTEFSQFKQFLEIFTLYAENTNRKMENSQVKGNLFLGKKKKSIWIAISLIIVLLAGGVAFVVLRKNNTSDFPARPDGMGKNGAFSLSENMVAASGVISVGVTEESFDVENLTTGLVIEEVYISSEMEIEEGTKVLKLTGDSVRSAEQH